MQTMASLLKLVAGIVLAVILLVIAAGGLGSFLWSRATEERVAEIVARARPPRPATTTELPAPVRRYLDRVLPEGTSPIRLARVHQRGEFLLSPPDGWEPFTAIQLFTVDPPAMVWDATIRMAPFVNVRIRDSYVEGTGSMHGAALGLVPVVRDSGSYQMAEASLVRYLAESPWFPTRLRPSIALGWSPVDDSTAVATLRDGALSVSLQFRFADDEIRQVYAERRFRGADEDPTWAPWIGHFDAYEEFDGFRVPTRGEVAWVIDGEERPYWRGRIESVMYEY